MLRKMKIYNKNVFIVALALMLVVTLGSCKKYLSPQPLAYNPTTAELFSSDATASSAVLTLYNQIPVFLTSYITLYEGVYSDELVYTGGWNTDYQPYSNSYVDPNDAVVDNFWQNIYAYIYIVNANIEGLNNSATLTPSVKQQLLGEAYFIRGYAYFILANTFCNVPLVISTDYHVNLSLSNTAQSDIYKQVIKDLTNAESLLLPAYPSSGRIRANKWAAAALLARTYLYTKDYQDAIKVAGMIIDQGGYGALPAAQNAFVTTSSEVILQLVPVQNIADNGYYSDDASNFIPYSPDDVPEFSLTPDLLAAFEPGDLRFSHWTMANTVDNVSYIYPAKYRNADGSAAPEDNILLRLPEQYLIRAEASAQLGQLPQAIEDIDMIRKRAGLPLIAVTNPTINQTNLIAKIANENRIEFFAELGHRWMDLKRTGQAADVLKALKPDGWKDASINWPIPQPELDTNPFLKQNPNY